MDFDRGTQKITTDKLNSIAVPEPKRSKAKETKEWTIMIFMNGKNNLADYVLKDINEMEVYGTPSNMNIVVEAGRINYTPPSYDSGYDDYPDVYPWGGGIHPWQHPLPPYLNKNENEKGMSTFTGIKRILIQKDSDTNVINSPVIETLEKADMGDPNHLVDFALWAKKNYPAQKYMLIIWNHGDGWKSKKIMPDLIKGISSDDETGNEISTVELGEAINKIGKLDIYASDACLMQMIEVVYELKDKPSIIIGSEETEPGDGWAYDYFLKKIANLSYIAPETLAKAVVDGYGEYYKEKGKGVTQSAVRTNKIDTLRYMIDLWADTAMKNIDKAKLKESINKSLGFEASGSRDLIDYIKIASIDSGNQELINKANEIEKFINENVIIKRTNVGDSYKNANGLAIYIPTYNYDSKYDNLKFAKTGIWDDFLKWLYQ